MRLWAVGILTLLLMAQGTAWARKPASSPKHVVIVNRNENLLDVAKRVGTTTDDLIKSNGLKKPYQIYIGQPLMYHQVAAAQPEPKPVKVTPKTEPVKTKAEKKDAPEPDKTKVAIAEPENIKRTGKHFSWPVQGKILSSFGKKQMGFTNDGINIEAKFQTSVKAAEDGVVAYAGNEIRGFGNVILLKHGEGWSSVYAHNDILLVAKGERVKRGQEIAKSGNTGHVDTPQLHFELRHKAEPVDPTQHLK